MDNSRLKNEEKATILKQNNNSLFDLTTNVLGTINRAMNGFNNPTQIDRMIDGIQDFLDQQWASNHRTFIISNKDYPAIDINGNSFLLKRTNYKKFFEEEPGIYVRISGTNKNEKGDTVISGSQIRFMLPIKSKPIIIPATATFVFFDEEDKINFLKNNENTPLFDVYLDYLLGTREDIPGIKQIVTNISDKDYFTVINKKVFCIPKANKDVYNSVLSEELKLKINELSIEHDIILIKSYSNYTSNNSKINIQTNYSTPNYELQLIPIPKKKRTSLQPLYIPEANMMLFTNINSAESFCNGPSKGSVEKYIVSKLMEIYEKELQIKIAEREKERREENRSIANLFYILVGSGILTTVTLLSIKFLNGKFSVMTELIKKNTPKELVINLFKTKDMSKALHAFSLKKY